MILTIIVTMVTIRSWTLGHVVDEGDNCAKAQACKHDGAEARGIDADGRTVRLFLDACDLHEYNCDQGTNFKLVTVTSPCTEERVTRITEPDSDNDKNTPENPDNAERSALAEYDSDEPPQSTAEPSEPNETQAEDDQDDNKNAIHVLNPKKINLQKEYKQKNKNKNKV